MTSFEVAFFRSLFNLIASTGYLCAFGASLKENIDETNRCVLVVRCLSGSICFLCFVVAIEHLPISVFFVMLNSTPFFVTVLACLWLKEMISPLEVVTMVGAFCGILLLGLSKGDSDESEALDDS